MKNNYCPVCGEYLFDNDCDCKEHKFFITTNKDYFPNDNEWNTTYLLQGYNLEEKVEKLASDDFDENPSDLGERYVFIDNMKYTVSLELTVICKVLGYTPIEKK